MSSEQFSRTERLIGAEAMDILQKARVIVFGVGGVGGYAVEALARSGVGAIDLVDKDTVDITNLNRQIIATLDTVGRSKTEVMQERIRSINPDCTVNVYNTFYLPETKDRFHLENYSYVIDAIDTITAKITLVLAAQEAGTPVISCMGAGNKLDPSRFEVADIYDTSVCPLARVMRRELKKYQVKHLKVVYSKELPCTPAEIQIPGPDGMPVRKKATPGSIAFVPSVAGMILGGEVIKDLIGKHRLRDH